MCLRHGYQKTDIEREKNVFAFLNSMRPYNFIPHFIASIVELNKPCERSVFNNFVHCPSYNCVCILIKYEKKLRFRALRRAGR